VAGYGWQREAWRELPEAFDARIGVRRLQDGRGPYAKDPTPRKGPFRTRARQRCSRSSMPGSGWEVVDRSQWARLYTVNANGDCAGCG